MGAFLYFPQDPPAELRNTTYAVFGLTTASFRLTRTDPLAPVRSVPPEVLETLTNGAACLSCHTFRSAGARSHHVTAADGTPEGGYALALEEYPADVLRRFIYDQKAVADTMGVNPLMVPEPAATLLHNLVVAERTGRSSQPQPR